MGLLDDALRACGGLARWRQLKRFTVHISIDGSLFAGKGKSGLLKDVVAEGCTQSQSVRFTGFTAPDRRGLYRPDRVAIETLSGRLLEERANPLEAFPGHADDTRWDDLHLLFFCGFSVWNWLTTPFLLAHAGVGTEELPLWREGRPDWRRLRAVFPRDIVTHSPEQIFYFDAAGLQRRTDYQFVDTRGIRIAHYSWAHQAFSNILLPTLRQSLLIRPDGTIVRKPAFVDIEIFDASFA